MPFAYLNPPRFPARLKPDYSFFGAAREYERALADLIKQLLGNQFLTRHPEHPGARAYVALSDVAPEASYADEVMRLREDYSLTGLALANLFPIQPISLSALGAFAKPEYITQIQKRVRDPGDFFSVLSELWIANSMREAGFGVEPILRHEGEQADFVASYGASYLQVECKITQVGSTFRSIKEKAENSNRQFKAHTESTPGLLVMHVVGAPIRVEQIGSLCEMPPQIQEVTFAIERVFRGGAYTSVSAALVIWDAAFTEGSGRAAIRICLRANKLIKHPMARRPLPEDLPLDRVGMTSVSGGGPIKITPIPDAWPADGPYSVAHRYIPPRPT